LPEIEGAAVLAGGATETTCEGVLVTQLEPLALVAVTITLSVSPTSAASAT
jgi:hypothetical protein